MSTVLGALAQLVECHTGSVDVSGSSPLCSTIHKKVCICRLFIFIPQISRKNWN